MTSCCFVTNRLWLVLMCSTYSPILSQLRSCLTCISHRGIGDLVLVYKRVTSLAGHTSRVAELIEQVHSPHLAERSLLMEFCSFPWDELDPPRSTAVPSYQDAALCTATQTCVSYGAYVRAFVTTCLSHTMLLCPSQLLLVPNPSATVPPTPPVPNPAGAPALPLQTLI